MKKKKKKNLRASSLLARVLVVPVLAAVPVAVTAVPAHAAAHSVDGGVRGVR
jgi:hypothetical protein